MRWATLMSYKDIDSVTRNTGLKDMLYGIFNRDPKDMSVALHSLSGA